MTIDRNSRLYRWAYLFTDEWRRPKEHVNLCPFFWRVVLISPLACIFTGLLIAIFGLPILFITYVWEPYVRVPYLNWSFARKERKHQKRMAEFEARWNAVPQQKSTSFIDICLAWLSAKKAKVCPRIALTGGSSPE